VNSFCSFGIHGCTVVGILSRDGGLAGKCACLLSGVTSLNPARIYWILSCHIKAYFCYEVAFNMSINEHLRLQNIKVGGNL